MAPISFIAANWQKALPLLAAIGAVEWIALFRDDPLSERALFAALLVIYFVHQIEEHLWPGGFRQFADAHVFHSGNDDWPVDMGGVALINIGYVWLPIALAALFPETLRWLGLGWIGLTLINGIIHVVTTIRLRIYNPGLITGLLLFIPFTVFVLVHEVARGALSGTEVGLIVLLGVVLHVPAGALFVVPFLRRRWTKA
ncbi:MAG: HXXEE domain-containing protein [Methylovirgula sp.]